MLRYPDPSAGRFVVQVLAQPGLPERAEPARYPRYRSGEGHGQLRQVLALGEVAGVGARAHEDYGVLPHLHDLGVVPAATEVVPRVVVCRVGHPFRVDLPVLRLGEVEKDLLPVGLVVVGAEEPAPPVVEGVEEPVLQDHPAVLAEHAPVVAVVLVLGHYALVGFQGCRRGLPGDPAAGEERDGVQGVHEAREVTDARQTPPPGPEGLPRLFTVLGVPAEHLQASLLLVDLHLLDVAELQEMDRTGLVEGLLGEPLQAQFAVGHHAPGLPAGFLDPQAAVSHVGFHVHRVEAVAPGRPDHRLEALEQGRDLPRVVQVNLQRRPPNPAWRGTPPSRRGS